MAEIGDDERDDNDSGSGDDSGTGDDSGGTSNSGGQAGDRMPSEREVQEKTDQALREFAQINQTPSTPSGVFDEGTPSQEKRLSERDAPDPRTSDDSHVSDGLPEFGAEFGNAFIDGLIDERVVELIGWLAEGSATVEGYLRYADPFVGIALDIAHPTEADPREFDLKPGNPKPSPAFDRSPAPNTVNEGSSLRIYPNRKAGDDVRIF